MQKTDSSQIAMLTGILDGMEALITVMDPKTFQILFINESIRNHFGITESGEGQLCHKLLQKLDAPCPTCPYQRLKGDLGATLVWEHHEAVKGSILRKTAKLIDWPGGITAHLEYAVDITAERKAQQALEISEQQLRDQNRLLYAVNDMSAILLQSGVDSFDRDLSHSLGLLAEAANVDRVSIWKNNYIGGELYFSQIIEWPHGVGSQQDKDLIYGVPYRDALPSWEETFLKRKTVNSLVRELPGGESAYLSGYGLVSVLAVPLYLKKEFWGFISFDNCHGERVFSNNEEEILRSACELIANALLRSRMEKNILHLEGEVDKIYYDSLTGIYNRRYFDETANRVIRSLARAGSVFSILMIDIDYFKLYNDTYGHVMGDKCLRIIAKTLQNSVTRTEDFVARYGGEEFVVVLPNTDEAGAHLMANRLLEAVRGCRIPHETSAAAEYVTISMGVMVGSVAYSFDNDFYIKHADAMLYESKQNGRNRYTLKKIN